MQTEILQGLDLSRAVHALQSGIPVVIPTETVYGLAAPLFQEDAIKKIFSIKGRPLDNPMIAHIASLGQTETIAEDLSYDFYRLAETFWPGPLTLVVKKQEIVPAIVSAGYPTIAIRMPAHKIALRLIEEVGAPLVAPSANLSGLPSPTRVEDVLEDMAGKVPYIVDGGNCEIGIESTVLYLGSSPTLLRPGKITKEQLEEFLKKKVSLAKKGGPALSPGMKYKHYAPKASIKLIFRKEDLGDGWILSPEQIEGKKTALLSSETFYAKLREADRHGIELIEIYCSEKIQKDMGLMNRILRASGQ